MNTNEDTQTPKLMLKSTKDALLIIEAAELGLFPRLVRRLTEQERAQSIYSGAVFVYDEFESHIRRFTDTLIWSPSRIVGNYLVYREMRKHEPRPTSRAGAALPPQPASARSLARPRPDMVMDQNEKDHKKREQLYVGSLTHSSKFKPDGLVKRTFSLMTEGKHIHVIGYYTYEDAMNEAFITPSEHPEFADLLISQELLQDKSLYRVPPRIEQLANGQLVYAGEDPEKPASPRSESASLDADRDTPSASSSTRGTPGFPVPPSLPALPPINIQPQEDAMYELPPLRSLPPSRTWEGTSAHNSSNLDGPAYSCHPRPDAVSHPFSGFGNPAAIGAVPPASLSTIPIPSMSPPPNRSAPRLRDARQGPYPDNQVRPHAYNLNAARFLREPEHTPTNPLFAPASAPEFTPIAPPPAYHEQWPAPQMGFNRGEFSMRQGQPPDETGGSGRCRTGVLAPVPVRPRMAPRSYEHEVGPSGETVEYDAPAGRYPRTGDTRVLSYPDETPRATNQQE